VTESNCRPRLVLRPRRPPVTLTTPKVLVPGG
jgi:hypothetical protein